MFLAAISLTSCVTGLLATIYSTSLDRASELVKAAKAYLYWYKDKTKSVTFVRDTDRMYTLRTQYGDVEVAARPKNAGTLDVARALCNSRVRACMHSDAPCTMTPFFLVPEDSCRGDAPHLAMFDEVAFLMPNFW